MGVNIQKTICLILLLGLLNISLVLASNFYEENGTIKCENASVGEWGVVNGINYTKVNESILRSMNPNTDNFSIVCTSGITNMNSLFLEASSFNQDISTWDTSSVTNMASMFEGASSFNQPIGNWDVSKVKWMTNMFYGAESFNQPIGNWNTSTVQYMGGMFAYATSFNQPIGNWDTSNVRLMSNMFKGASSFNQPIGSWDTSNVEDMSYMFNEASAFNQNISGWDTSSVTNMEYMFYNSPFNQPIGNWDTSSVTNMQWMFAYAYNFNQSIGDWNVSNVENMDYMFYYATSFNQPIGDWNTSNVLSMQSMFEGASAFNQDISTWDTSSVINMVSMFAYAYNSNQSIGDWNVSNVESMDYMFYYATSFNQPIGNWNTSNVQYMEGMFAYATSFNQDLTSWCVINIPTEPIMFSTGSPLTEEHKPIWGTCGAECTNHTDCGLCEKCINYSCVNQSNNEDLKDECDISYTSCLNAYTRQGSNGYCDGAGSCDTSSSLLNVSPGNVCINGNDTNPTSSVYCSIWKDCIAGLTSAEEYYVGYAGNGTSTCVDTDWVNKGTIWETPEDYEILITEHAENCTITSTTPFTYEEEDLTKTIFDKIVEFILGIKAIALIIGLVGAGSVTYIIVKNFIIKK